MTKLTDTQSIVLSAASQRPGRRILPLPEHIKGGAVKKVVTGLITRALAVEISAERDDQVWREGADGRPLTLAATDAALDALGIAPEGGDSAPTGADAAPSSEAPEDTSAEATPAPKVRTPRAGTKQAKLIEMLRAEGGATIAEIVDATGWQPHTVRGAIAGSLKKKLGLDVTSEKVDGRGRVYAISREG
jgi:hypothetical protein